MFKKLIHTRISCFVFFVALLVFHGIFFSEILPIFYDWNQGFVVFGFVCMMTGIASLMGLISSLGGCSLDMINLAKPHKATLVKGPNGRFRVEVVRFPFWSSVECEQDEDAAVSNYAKEKQLDEERLKLVKESGPIRVITEPSGPKINSISDAYEHIESLLKQYAPEKVDAIRKLKEVFEKKD